MEKPTDTSKGENNMGTICDGVEEVDEPRKPVLDNGRPPLTAFEQELRRLINRFSMENHSNTPDRILAEYLCSCLSAFNYATRAREQWYG